MGVSFSPAASTNALTAIRRINYYGRFCPSALYPTLRHIDLILARWAAGKFKSLRGHKRRSRHWVARIARHQPRLFAHWSLLYGSGRTMGAG